MSTVKVSDPVSSFSPNPDWPALHLKMEYQFNLKKVREEHKRNLAQVISKNDSELDEYCYCLEAYMEASCKVYQAAARFAAENGFDTVVDIGCACGTQGDLFEQVGVKYIGIEACRMKMFPGIQFIQKTYPCALDLDSMGIVLGVSNLCVGFQVESYQEIAEQFSDFLLCSCREGYDGLAKYYDKHVIIQEPDHFGWVWYQK